MWRRNQCCGARMFIPDPGSWFLPIPDTGSRIPYPKTATKERGETKFVVIRIFIATNFAKMKIILFLKCLKGHGNEPNFPRFLHKSLWPSPLHYISSSSDFGFEFAEIFVFEKRLPVSWVGESTRLPGVSIFFKPLNNYILIVHYIPG